MTYTVPTRENESKPLLWDRKYIVPNLPLWIYTDNKEPDNEAECRAKISSLEYTLQDIDLQIEIREIELRTGNSRHSTSFEYDKWKAQALRARQTHLYLLNAYKYWLLLNEKKTGGNALNAKLNSLIKVLIEDPEDPVEFVTQLEQLLRHGDLD